MARLRATESEVSDHSELYRRPTTPPESHSHAQQHASQSPSPLPSTSSDKENRSSTTRSKLSMGPPSAPASNPDAASRAAKRRRLEEQPVPSRSQSIMSDATSVSRAGEYYDPNQDIEERRRVRKGFRELEKETTDNRSEWMDPNSKGLIDAVQRADQYFHSVKQTSDATLDSRILVTAGDLTHKKAQQTVLGDGAQGIDIDEFVSKCIAFMREGDEDDNQTNSSRSRTQRRRARATEIGSDDEEGPDTGDALNWEWLGARACFPFNRRPPVPGFLLGPLSVQKRARQQRPRRERLQRARPADATRPQQLKASDLQKQENASLTRMCNTVYHQLQSVLAEGEENVQADISQLESRGVTVDQEKVDQLAEKHNLTDDGGVSLFRFALNPKSFGQTVENLFYVSFLIKDGFVGFGSDKHSMPTLHDVHEEEGHTRDRRQEGQKYQAVFSIDFETWKELISVFNIEESLIPTRNDDAASVQVRDGRWYA